MTKNPLTIKNKVDIAKIRVLFILHIPPPIDGAAMIGKYIKESKLINEKLEADYINLTSSFNLQNIGKYNTNKFKVVINILYKVFIALKNNNYDRCYMTVTSNGAGLYKDFLIVLLLKLFKREIIYHFHNKGVLNSSKKWYNHLIFKIIFNRSECILLAPILYNDIKQYISKKNVYICNNGIQPMVQLNPLRKKIIIYGKSIRFLFLSNMMKEKGVYELLEACQILKSKDVLFTCEFIGAWSDITELEFNKAVKNLELQKHVFMHGKKYEKDRISYLQNADVLVLPTYYHNECFPLVILEAMQFGLPVISTPEGAISEIVIEGQTGLLIEQKNSKALAEAMLYLIVKPNERVKMGKNSRKRFESRYTIKTFEKRLLQILNSSINEKRKFNLDYEQNINIP